MVDMDSQVDRYFSSAFIGLFVTALIAGMYGWLLWVYNDSSLFPSLLSDSENIALAQEYQKTRTLLFGTFVWGATTMIAYIAKGIELGKMAKVRAEVRDEIDKKKFVDE